MRGRMLRGTGRDRIALLRHGKSAPPVQTAALHAKAKAPGHFGSARIGQGRARKATCHAPGCRFARDGSARPGPLQTAQARHLAHGRSLSPCPAGGLSDRHDGRERHEGGAPLNCQKGGLAPSLRQGWVPPFGLALPGNVSTSPGFSAPGSAVCGASAALVAGWAGTCPLVCVDPRGGDEGACFQGGRPGHQVTARPCLFRPPQPQPSPVGVQIFSPRTVRKTASTISSSGWSLRASARAESCEGASTMTRFPDPSVTPKYTMAIPVL